MGTQKKIYQLDAHASLADTDVLPISATSSGDAEKVTIATIKSELSAPVDSVNGKTGTVVLDTGDITEDTDKNYVTDAQKVVIGNTSGTNTGDQDLSGKQDVLSEGPFINGDKTKLDGIAAGAEANTVDSVNGETGIVVLDTGDITEVTDKNYVTDAQKVVIGNTSGTNTGDMSDAEVKTAYENNANTNAFTDAEKTNLGNQSGTNTGDQDSSMAITDADDYFNTDTVEGALSEVGEKQKYINGFNRTDTYSTPDIAFDDTTRVFTASVQSGASNYYFRCNGKKFIKTTDQTITLPDTTGTYYTYFDNSGVLQYVEQSTIGLAFFTQYSLTGLVYWNATQGYSLMGAGDENHGKDMDGMTHIYNHYTSGAKYSGGMGLNGVTGGSSTTFTSIDSGYMWDEDIKHTLSSATTMPFIYRLGTAGEWTKTAADNNLAHIVSGDTYASWNEDTGTTRQLTEATSSTDYFITFIVSTPQGYAKVIGQGAYSSRTNARNAVGTELQRLNANGLPTPEIVFLYAIIVYRDGKAQSLSDGSDYLDLRFVKGVGGNSGTSTSPLTTKGDLYTFDTGDTRLGIGSDGQVLTADSGEATGIKWATASSGFSDPMTTRGDIIIRNASNTTDRLGIGTSGYVLTSDGTDISWAAAGGGSGSVTVLYSDTIAGEQVVSTVIERPAGQAFTLSKLKISLGVLPTGADFTVDLEKNGTSVLSAALSIATTDSATNGLYTVSTGDTGKATISTSAFSENDRITLKITQVGSTIPGSDFTYDLIVS